MKRVSLVVFLAYLSGKSSCKTPVFKVAAAQRGGKVECARLFCEARGQIGLEDAYIR